MNEKREKSKIRTIKLIRGACKGNVAVEEKEEKNPQFCEHIVKPFAMPLSSLQLVTFTVVL